MGTINSNRIDRAIATVDSNTHQLQGLLKASIAKEQNDKLKSSQMAKRIVQLEALVKELSGKPAQSSGFGHQFKKDVKALDSSATSLQQAYDSLLNLTNPDAVELRNDILKLMNRSKDLAYSAEQSVNQNS